VHCHRVEEAGNNCQDILPVVVEDHQMVYSQLLEHQVFLSVVRMKDLEACLLDELHQDQASEVVGLEVDRQLHIRGRRDLESSKDHLVDTFQEEE